MWKSLALAARRPLSSSGKAVDLWTRSQEYIRATAKTYQLDENIIHRLTHSANTIKVQFGVRMDPDAIDLQKPSQKVFEGYRSQHATHVLPSLGGFMIGPNVSLDQVTSIGALNTLQFAIMDIPMSGSCGGINADYYLMSEIEKTRLVKSYSRAIVARGYCNPAFDIITPGYGTSAKEMSWVVDTFRVFTKDQELNHLACVAGKAPNAQGINNGKSLQAKGSCIQIENALLDPEIQKVTRLKPGIEGKKFIISGFGKVGQHLAKELVNRGGICVGIIDRKNSIYSSEGINIDHAQHFRKIRNSWLDFPDVELYDDANQVVSQESDLFLPCSTVGMVSEELAANLNTKLLVEVSKAACTFEAVDILNKNGIYVVPALLAESGTMLLHYLEWLKNISHRSLGKLQSKYDQDSNAKFAKEILKILNCNLSSDLIMRKSTEEKLIEHVMEDLLTTAWQRVSDFREKHQADIKSACYAVALEEIISSYKTYGITM